MKKSVKARVENKIPKMINDMKKLVFVQWDRFTINNEKKIVDVFGWINRKDNYKDFVLLEYKCMRDNIWDTSFSTSSKIYSTKIFKLLECEGKHNDCNRVEEEFDITNCIRLKTKGD